MSRMRGVFCPCPVCAGLADVPPLSIPWSPANRGGSKEELDKAADDLFDLLARAVIYAAPSVEVAAITTLRLGAALMMGVAGTTPSIIGAVASGDARDDALVERLLAVVKATEAELDKYRPAEPEAPAGESIEDLANRLVDAIFPWMRAKPPEPPKAPEGGG